MNTTRAPIGWINVAICCLCALPAAAQRMSDAYRVRGEAVADRLEAYLLSQQDQASGGWGVNPQGVSFPAITGLVLNGLLLDPQADQSDPAIASAARYLIGWQQPNGGIYDKVLPSYNTSCSISALARIDSPEARKAVRDATEFLLTLQWQEPGQSPGQETPGPGAKHVERSHPYYGGVGYGSHSRPDASNLTLFLQALEDAGYEHDGPAVQRALVFLSRIQMDERINDMAYANGSSQGGFIYSTGTEGDTAGQGESKAGMIEETLDDGSTISRLRAYGSMTYAGFKSFAYAKLADDDSRVESARRWLSTHYTLDENPGLGMAGFYYYILVFGRAMDAWGEPVLEVDGGDQRWAEDLIDRLEALQNDYGSMRSLDDRWMEADPVLISAYSLIALRHALHD